MLVGGKGGVTPRLGDSLALNVPEEKLFHLIEKIIEVYADNAHGKERLGDYIDRVGLEQFKGLLDLENVI